MPTVFAAFARPDIHITEPPEAAWVISGSYPTSLTRPTFNQSEADFQSRQGLAIYSREGQAFRNAIVHRARPLATLAVPQKQILYRHGADGGPGPGGRTAERGGPLGMQRSVGTRDGRGVVIREMAPLRREPYGQHNGYQDFVGAFLARVATTIPVVAAIRYQGQAPLFLQPKVIKPDPWNDPSRGRP